MYRYMLCKYTYAMEGGFHSLISMCLTFSGCGIYAAEWRKNDKRSWFNTKCYL